MLLFVLTIHCGGCAETSIQMVLSQTNMKCGSTFSLQIVQLLFDTWAARHSLWYRARSNGNCTNATF
jgi:hypothetical protein